MLSLDAFKVLLMAVEPHSFSEEFARSVFDTYAEIAEDEKEYLSLQKLSAMSIKQGLFGEKAQERLVGHGGNPQTEMLPGMYPTIRDVIAERLRRAGILGPEWEARMEMLQRRVGDEQYSARGVWMAYRIVFEFSANMMKRTELERLYPGQFAKICSEVRDDVKLYSRPSAVAHKSKVSPEKAVYESIMQKLH